MTSQDIPDEAEDNPFESHGESSSVDSITDPELQLPPVERSYWIGVVALVFFGLLGSFVLAGSSVLDQFPIFSAVFNAVCTFALSLCFFIPFALIRLAIHRRNIVRAIHLGTYPGTQRFGLWYLIYSIFISWFCLISGGLLFFGVCSALFFLGPNPSAGPFYGFWVLLSLDGLFSLLLAGFLFKLGIPKYR